MSKMIQIRGVPDELHRTLKSRAAKEGMNLSDYLKRELKNIAACCTWHEWLERNANYKPIARDKSAAEIIRELRDSR